ncbi:MAG: hypothetical protein OQK24_08270 [Magnetovibrio sp.]|nr:hypothetical protein [Magnetovibrio sp.]
MNKSTRTTDLTKAVDVAKEKYKEAKDRTTREQAIKALSFRDAAEERLRELLDDVDLGERRGEIKKNHATNIRGELRRTLTDHLPAFFEDHLGKGTPIDKIGKVDCDVYPHRRQDRRAERHRNA